MLRAVVCVRRDVVAADAVEGERPQTPLGRVEPPADVRGAEAAVRDCPGVAREPRVLLAAGAGCSHVAHLADCQQVVHVAA